MCCEETNIVPNPAPHAKGCCGETKHTPFTKYSLLNAGVSVIRHYLDPTYDAFSSDEVREARLKACDECDKLTKTFGKKQCQICKCFVEPKAALIDQNCPHTNGSKW